MKKLLENIGGRKFLMVGLTVLGLFGSIAWVLIKPELVAEVSYPIGIVNPEPMTTSGVLKFVEMIGYIILWLVISYITGNVTKPLVEKLGGQQNPK